MQKHGKSRPLNHRVCGGGGNRNKNKFVSSKGWGLSFYDICGLDLITGGVGSLLGNILRSQEAGWRSTGRCNCFCALGSPRMGVGKYLDECPPRLVLKRGQGNRGEEFERHIGIVEHRK